MLSAQSGAVQTPVGVFFTAFLPLGVNEQALYQQPHFVPRLRLGLVGGRLVSLGQAAPAGLGRILRFIRLLALIRGRSLFRGLALRRPIPGSGKIHHLSRGGGISHAGDRGLLLVLAQRRTLLRRSRSVLIFGSLLTRRSRLLRRRGRCTLDAPSTTEASALAGAG